MVDQSRSPPPINVTNGTATPSPSGGGDGGLPVAAAVAVGAVGIVVGPVLTLVLFWLVYEAMWKRKQRRTEQSEPLVVRLQPLNQQLKNESLSRGSRNSLSRVRFNEPDSVRFNEPGNFPAAPNLGRKSLILRHDTSNPRDARLSTEGGTVGCSTLQPLSSPIPKAKDGDDITLAIPAQNTTDCLSQPAHSAYNLLPSDARNDKIFPDSRRLSNKSLSLGAPSVDLRTDTRSLEVLDQLQTAVNPQHTTRLNCCRGQVLETALRALQKPGFHPTHALAVKFVAVREEPASPEDRVFEFFKLLLLEMCQLAILTGCCGQKTLAFSADALNRELYRHVGCLLSMSLVHGGPPPQFFASSAYSIMQSGSEGLAEAPTRQCWQQFLSGLSTLGVLEAIQSDPEAMKPYFQAPEVQLKAADVQSLFEHSIDFSREGSAECQEQQRTVTYFLEFLDDVEADLSTVQLSDVVACVTGSPSISTLGYSNPPKLSFSRDDGHCKIERANGTLHLPLLADYGAFKQAMEETIKSARI